MGLFSWLRRRRRRQQTANMPGVISTDSRLDGGFVIVDVETTGLTAARDRVVEIAVIRTDTFGRILDEWATLIDPGGSVGASRVHGIAAGDVRGAPRFAEVVGEVTERMAGRALVAHNARFDMAFIRSEYARAGWTFPDVPYLCTMEASWIYLPHLARRRLSDCCWACGISLHEAHSALGDARATAHLLATYLDPGIGERPQPVHVSLPEFAARVAWPPVPKTFAKPRLRRVRAAEVPAAAGLLWALLDALPLSTVVEEGAPETSGAYLELLMGVLEDGVLTDAEAGALVDVAREYALTRQQVEATHRAFLLALAHRIVEDGKVTRDERELLADASKSLGFDGALPGRVLDEAWAALHASRAQSCLSLPEDWAYGAPVRIGQAVAFTGCDQLVRARQEGQAQAAGLRVTGSVSRRTAVLVTDGANPNTAKATAAGVYGTRVVTPEVFAHLVKYIQPATELAVVEQTGSRDGHVRAPLGAGSLSVDDPAAIRAWARENGHRVGVRGRVPTDLAAAYRAANNK